MDETEQLAILLQSKEVPVLIQRLDRGLGVVSTPQNVEELGLEEVIVRVAAGKDFHEGVGRPLFARGQPPLGSQPHHFPEALTEQRLVRGHKPMLLEELPLRVDGGECLNLRRVLEELSVAGHGGSALHLLGCPP